MSDMVYDNSNSWRDGQWHCPFPREWVERMRLAASRCKRLSADDIDAMDGNVSLPNFPPSNFISEEQDARGLPPWYCREEEERFKNLPERCTATYDYDTIPDVMVSNGKYDWPLNTPCRFLQT